MRAASIERADLDDFTRRRRTDYKKKRDEKYRRVYFNHRTATYTQKLFKSVCLETAKLVLG